MKYFSTFFPFLWCISMAPLFSKSLETMPKQLDNKTIYINVFIHGSVYAGLSFFNIQQVLSDTISTDSFYAYVLEKIRANPEMQQHHLMLNTGWEKIPSSIIEKFNTSQFDSQEAKKSVYQCIPAYDAFAKRIDNTNSKHVYYTFGHLGMLSQKYRSKVGNELYHNLCDTIENYKKSYTNVVVNIITHSHAGNIAFNLAKEEIKYQRKLVIDSLIMFGTPLQQETAEFAYQKPFNLVINFYSHGDIIQGSDALSTKRRKSFKKFSDKRLKINRNPNAQVYDIRLMVNNNSIRIDHINMFTLGKSIKATHSLDPLPIAILTPIIVNELKNHDFSNQLECNIVDQYDNFHCQLDDQQKQLTVDSPSYKYLTRKLKNLVKLNWKPDNTSRTVIFNQAVLIEAVKSFFKKKHNQIY